jgi:hypothetical protein
VLQVVESNSLRRTTRRSPVELAVAVEPVPEVDVSAGVVGLAEDELVVLEEVEFVGEL